MFDHMPPIRVRQSPRCGGCPLFCGSSDRPRVHSNSGARREKSREGAQHESAGQASGRQSIALGGVFDPKGPGKNKLGKHEKSKEAQRPCFFICPCGYRLEKTRISQHGLILNPRALRFGLILNPRALRFLGFNKIAQLIFSRALTRHSARVAFDDAAACHRFAPSACRALAGFEAISGSASRSVPTSFSSAASKRPSISFSSTKAKTTRRPCLSNTR